MEREANEQSEGVARAGRWAMVSRRVVTPSGVRAAAVLVDGETIAEVTDPSNLPASVRVEDVGERMILPGLVDTHVHINEPGRTEWEGFATATRAAAAGGITTLVDMPLNSSPVTTSVPSLTCKLAAARDKLMVDCGFYAGASFPAWPSTSGRWSPPGCSGSRLFSVTRGSTSSPMPARPTSAP